eukprot:1255417-Rhodomonas_salina.1
MAPCVSATTWRWIAWCPSAENGGRSGALVQVGWMRPGSAAIYGGIVPGMVRMEVLAGTVVPCMESEVALVLVTAIPKVFMGIDGDTKDVYMGGVGAYYRRDADVGEIFGVEGEISSVCGEICGVFSEISDVYGEISGVYGEIS